MKYTDTLTARDREIAELNIKRFLPVEIYDIHAHPCNPAHVTPGVWTYMTSTAPLGSAEYQAALSRYMAGRSIPALYFGLPHKSGDRAAQNAWVAQEAAKGAPLSRALLLVSPEDNRDQVAANLRSGNFCGIKVYHCYVNRPDTMNSALTEFAPDWMWELVHEIRGVLMVHLVKDAAIADPGNQAEIRRLCRAYPECRLVLAHVGRSFNYRNARSGLRAIADVDNAVVDTSAICESQAFQAALEILGPRRILWGSDFPISELRGRCVTTGSSFYWLYPEEPGSEGKPRTSSEMTLVGIESLLALREACEDAGLTATDIQDIFARNAKRILSAHLPAATDSSTQPSVSTNGADGSALWQRARNVISGGTGLLSKRAEMFDAQTWPAYFSRCSGCEVWDLSGRRYIDFAGGIGAVFLGYADPDVTVAIKRRVSAGSYCSLVSPDEVELAEQLLALHPWAGKVRYARGGGEAMAMAVRIARAATGKSGVAFCGYHGWHDWYLAANLGATNALDGHLLPGLEPRGVPRELAGTSVPFRYNDLASLDAALAKLNGNVAAVVMEPMRSQLSTDDFVARVAAKCRATGAVFVVDEVTSGLRFGFPGALSRLGVAPDVVAYAKAFGNGFPFGTVIGREEIMKAANASFISSSYWTDGVGPAACLAVLEKVRRLQVHETVWKRGIEFHKTLNQLAAAHPVCRLVVSGMPATPTIAFDLGANAPLAKTLFVRKMRERGFLVTTVFFLMLAHEPQHIELLLENLNEVLNEMEPIIAANQLASHVSTGGSQGFARLT